MFLRRPSLNRNHVGRVRDIDQHIYPEATIECSGVTQDLVKPRVHPLIERLGFDTHLEEGGDGHVALQSYKVDIERPLRILPNEVRSPHAAQGLLVDPAMHDIQTLATINEVSIDGGQSSGDRQRSVVPYIFIAPSNPNAIGEVARDLYRERYASVRGPRRSHDLSLLGRFIGASQSATRGELLSYLFFAGDFAARLIELGQKDARRWIRDPHDYGHWQLRPVGNTSGAGVST